jgi:hypothetical protein
MDIKETCRSLAGGIVVYLVVASCSADDHKNPEPSAFDAAVASTTGGRSGNGKGGSSGLVANNRGGSSGLVDTSGGRSGMGFDGSAKGGAPSVLDAAIDSALDAISNPVRDARADTTTSGTRLRAKYIVGADGSKQFLGWHDSTTNADCSFVPAADGAMRCLPAFGSASGQINDFYVDSGCSQKVAQVFKANCVTPKYAHDDVVFTSSCGAGTTGIGYAVYSLGAKLTTAYYGSPANCLPINANAFDSLDMYAVGAEVPASTFVQGTATVE